MDKKINVLIIGAGKGGNALIELFCKEPEVNICGVVDINDDAPGIKLARQLGLPTGKDYRQFLKIDGLNTVIDVTGNPKVGELLNELLPSGVELLRGLSAELMWLLVEKKEKEIIEDKETIERLEELNRHFNESVETILNFLSMASVEEKSEIEYENPHLVRCWEVKNCQNTQCPAYKSENLRCWLIQQTQCGDKSREELMAKMDECKKCTVFKSARPDNISEIGESLYFILTFLHRQIKELSDDRRAILNILEDVEEANRQLKETQMKLIQSDKMAAIGQLAGGISHEINNPMGVILGFAQSIMKRIDQNNPLYLPLSSIEREAIRCKNLVHSLLIFSRTSGTAKTSMEINQAIEETLVLVEHQAKVRNIEIIKKYAPDLPTIIANRNQIQQVIMNLSNNAFDAMPQGGKLEISTKLVKRENGKPEIEIKLSDTGVGIPEEIKHRIFEPFFTTKEPGKGTGLGLSLCYEIVQKHNGMIDFESEKDKGTTFIIRLPIEEEFAEKEKKKILIVDDDQAVIDLITRFLKQFPEEYQFTSVTDGFRAGQALLEFNPELVILDLMLPGIDGFQVCRSIRGSEKTKQTRILAITGYDSPENREKIFTAGADGYLAKPFEIEELGKRISKLLAE